MKRHSPLRFILLSFLAAFMALLFNFLGAPFLRVLRNVFGASKYWTSGILFAGALWITGLEPLAILLISFWVAVGLYSEFEERGQASLLLAVFSALAGSAVIFAGAFLQAKLLNIGLREMLKLAIDPIVQSLLAGRKDVSSIKIDTETIINQFPSTVILLMMLSVSFALMFDSKVGRLLGLQFENVASRLALLEFKLPDSFIWVTMLTFLFSFVKVGPPWVEIVSSNIFNVFMGLYFFQGLAVLEVSFLAFRVGNFTRFLIYFFVVGQLFFLLSIVGVIDYWVDFRRRMKRLRTPEKNQKNGEHI